MSKLTDNAAREDLEADPSPLLCLGCAAVYSDAGGETLMCPHCGYVISRTLYCDLAEYGGDAAHYGYKYRKRYEERGLDSRCSIEPGDVLQFLGMAVASGVAYDVLKSVLYRIIRSCKEHGLAVAAELENSSELELFIQYVRSFAEGMPDATDEIRQACQGERYTTAYSRVAAPLLEEAILHRAPPPTEEQTKAVLLAARDKLVAARPPDTREYEGCWQSLPAAQEDPQPGDSTEEGEIP